MQDTTTRRLSSLSASLPTIDATEVSWRGVSTSTQEKAVAVSHQSPPTVNVVQATAAQPVQVVDSAIAAQALDGAVRQRVTVALHVLVVTAKRAGRQLMAVVVLASTVPSVGPGLKALAVRLEAGVEALILTAVLDVRAAVMEVLRFHRTLVKAILETLEVVVQVTTMTTMKMTMTKTTKVPNSATETLRSGIKVPGRVLG